MKQWKERARRLQAGVLAFAMCLSLAVTGAWAEGSGNKTGTVANGAFVADQTNKTLGETFTEGASNTVAGGDKIEITKTAKAVPCQDGNQFEVTLQVVTHDQEIKTVESPDAAVTLVIDVSGSMDYCSECGGDGSHNWGCSHYSIWGWGNGVQSNQTRLAAAQASAKDFLDSLIKKTPQNADGTYPARYMSVVSFAGSASRKCEWKDIMTKEGYDAVLGAINGLSADGGTNLEQGLSKANDLMGAEIVSAVDKGNKFTVALTDGKPTYAKTGQNKIGNGQNSSKAICDATVTTAKALKENSNAIYSVYYGDAADKCYSDVTVENFLKSFSNNVYSAADAGSLTDTFENISQTITMLTKAWEVTDPMGPNVKFEKVTSGQGTCVTATENGLAWDLKADTADVDGTTRTYTLKYLVTVDATGEDWDEEAVHPLNGYTALSYVIENENGGYTDVNGNPVTGENPPTIGFNVPGVIVERPERPWRIEYYKQTGVDANGYPTYPEEPNEITHSTEKAKVGTQVKLSEQVENYQTKYENFRYVSGENTILTIYENEDFNVIRLYYNRKTTSAVVNYHYALTVIDEDGSTTTEYDVPGDPVTGLFVGDEYSVTVPETSTYGGNIYDLDSATPNGGKISKLKENDNAIELYYKLTIDQRADASVVVDHVYTLHTYELEDGKYVAKDVVAEVPNVVSESGHKAGETYTASYYPTTGYGTYGFAGIVGKDNVKVLESGPNVITLNFEDWEDPRGEQLSLTVKHHYTKSVTDVVDGKVVTTVDPDNEVGHTDTIKFYAGETVTVAKQRVYNDETYEIGGASDTVTLPNPMDGAEYSLFYTLTKAPEKATVTVTHIYQTIPTKTVSVYTVGGDTEITTIKGEPKEDSRESDPAIELYDGESYTATPRTPGNGYNYVEDADGSTPDLTTKAPGEIFVIYQRDAEEKPDNENDAWIRETHIYYTNLETIVGGEVKTIRVYDGGETIDAVDKVGTLYEAEQKLTFGGNTYTLKTGEETVSKTLVKGDNGTIEFVYEREADDLTATSYTVNYEYYTRTMYVNDDGVAVWGEPVLDTETTETPTGGNGYVGQKVILDTGAKDGYYAMEGNPAATQFLAESGNEWIFQYVKDVPLEKVPVTVNHHITTKTLTVDGEFSFTQDLMGRPEYKYKGESYEAKALELGDNATLTLVNVNGSDVVTAETITGEASTGAVVIDFYYEIVIDYRASVGYSIQYYYYDVDYDGTETLTGEPPATTGQSYVGAVLDINPEKEDIKGYKLTESTFNGNDIMDLPSVTLVDGENKIVYVYKRTVDTRPTNGSVKVIHEYYADVNMTKLDSKSETITDNLPVPSKFTATPVTEQNDRTYRQETVDPALEINVDSDTLNVITIKYVRADTTYTVVHEYYTDGTLTGSTPSVVTTGKVGDVITADGITKVTTYGGNTYTYTSAAGAPLTLVQGENGTITLRYDRTTGGGGGGETTEDTYRLTIHYVYADGTTARDDYVRSGLRAGVSYSRTSPTISGYTADITLVEGTMPARNVEVTVTYTAETSESTETPEPTPAPTETPAPIEDLGDNDVPMNELPGDVVDLWDEDVALSDLPEELEELSDEDVPLAEVPATGDSLLTWLSGALASGAGLMWLGGRKKKEDEAEEI